MREAVAQIGQLMAAQEIAHVLVGLFDLNGTLRGKRLSTPRFLSALEGGFRFGSIPLCWDASDNLIDYLQLYEDHPGFPDFPARLLPTSLRPLPIERNIPLFLAEYAESGPGRDFCCRSLLRRLTRRLQDEGYEPLAGIEYEFTIFNEDEHSCRKKEFRDLVQAGPVPGGFSVVGTLAESEYHRELMDAAATMGLQLEALHHETESLEAALAPAPALELADRAALFKMLAKAVARRHGKLASFMARWTDKVAPNGGHVHLSLLGPEGETVFRCEEGELSPAMASFLAGLQRRLPQLTALLAPWVNSYSRFWPHYVTANQMSWGIENRTCAVRVIPGSSARLEIRLPGADANPYLSLAAILACGLEGILAQENPTEPMQCHSYDQAMDPDYLLPAHLGQAARALRESEFARQALGDVFVDHYAATREWEEREFRSQVTEWELRRYLLL